MKNYLKVITIDEESVTPKYIQLSNSIILAIEEGKILVGDLLPSINDLTLALEISRNTIERAYNELKKSGVVSSVPGKGFFISNTDIKKPIKILLLFNKLSSHKKIIYDSFISTLGKNVIIDFFIYNNNFNLFKKFLSERLDNYSKYVVIPHFLEGGENAYTIINTIPKEKLIILDKLVDNVTGSFGAVYEDFEKDIFGALEHLHMSLIKYSKIKIIFPDYTYHSNGILKGFKSFCEKHSLNFQVLDNITNENIENNTVYINLMEDDLVVLIEKIIKTNFVVGQDVGVISYNETPLKKMILNGVTTISTNFKLMGEETARLVLSNSTAHVPIPFTVTERNSL